MVYIYGRLLSGIGCLTNVFGLLLLSSKSRSRIPLLSKNSMDVIFAEYSHGWYDCSDGAYKFRIHISGLYHIFVCTLYFLHNDTAVVNVVKFRKLGSPILSAAKILNFISAMMSILGLQTAMISRFSENGDNYRKTMNAITGGFVYCIVIFVAVFMLICSRKNKKEGGNR